LLSYEKFIAPQKRINRYFGIAVIRKKLDEHWAKDKELVLSVDENYTNSEMLKSLTERVTLIGRIRKDTRLYSIPAAQSNSGRKRFMGIGTLPQRRFDSLSSTHTKR